MKSTLRDQKNFRHSSDMSNVQMTSAGPHGRAITPDARQVDSLDFASNQSSRSSPKELFATVQRKKMDCVQRAIRPGEDIDAATDPYFAGLAARRVHWGLPVAGAHNDGDTVAYLDDGNGHTYWGRNGHGRALPPGMVANAISRTHAEGDVLIQAFNAGGIGTTAHLISDRGLCGACGQNGGVRGMTRSVGFTTLIVESPVLSDVNFYSPV